MARAGVLTKPATLLYAMGGYAGQNIQTTANAGGASFSSNDTFNGWTVGGGIELAIEGAWTAKVEYLFYDLGSTNLTTPACAGLPATTWDVDTDGSLVRAGINYRFNGLKFGQ